MTIKNNFHEATNIIQTLHTLCAILEAVPVDLSINRVYFTENNKEVSINFSVKKKKFLLKVEKQTEPYVYSITETIRNKAQTYTKKHILSLDSEFFHEIKEIITK